ncbi:hypothetical protein G6009_00735 [Dietzia sp. SLG510A3-30A2]|nr:hypothetical protein [Dietzia sp. SLG510A3-30A2]
MDADGIDGFMRDLLDLLDDSGVYVLEQTPYDVVVDGTFDPQEVAEALSRKWTFTPKS